jgi:CRP-like cAMP-binding protein
MDDGQPSSQIDPEWANLYRPQAPRVRPLVEDLARLPVFSSLSAVELERVAGLVHLRQYAAGETVIRRGALQSGFYLVRSGAVRIVRQTAGGEPVEVDRLGPGELAGEFGLLDSAPRSSSLIAAESTELIGFFRPDLMSLMETHPDTGCRILLRLGEEMASRLRRDYTELRQRGLSVEGATTPAVTEVTSS